MRTYKLLLITACVGFLSLLSACDSRQSSISYQEQIRNHRKSIAEFMNEAEDSPFAASETVVQLSYFPIDEQFKVIATIKRISDVTQLTVGTSDGSTRIFTRYAMLEFNLMEKPCKLLVLKGMKNEGLFLAFADLTNDKTTYGGGRYINLTFSDQAEKITLDFNKAYNPYCEYSAEYSCPLPPAENYLAHEIKAGEKIYRP